MNNSIDQLFLLNNLVLNITGIPKLHGMVVSKYQTFRDERSRHLIKNIKFTQLFTNLNTTFYKIRFYYLKKKVLKEIIGRSYFSKHLLKNMLLYINNFYLYFWNIFFIKNINYRFGSNFFAICFNNPHLYIKDLQKIKQKINFDVVFKPMSLIPNTFFFNYLSQFLILTIDEISNKKK